MHEIKRIAFLGIGGVGGYYGGKLASCYAHSTEMEIIFIARNENEKAIREKGLLLRTASGEEYIHPKLISHDLVEIGTIDLLLCSVKAYNLEESLQQIQSCISPDTIILPLLNGVNNRTRIHALLPWVNCWQGCAYIVSRLIQPGIVHETGQWNQLLFGDDSIFDQDFRIGFNNRIIETHTQKNFKIQKSKLQINSNHQKFNFQS